MRLVHAAALLLLTVALCRAQEETLDEGTEEVPTTTAETTTLSLRNRLRPRLRLTTAAPTVLSSDGELQTENGGVTSAGTSSTPLSQTAQPKSKRPRNRNRNRKTTTPAATSHPSEEADDVKSTSRTTSRPKSRSRNRNNRNRSSSTTKAPADTSTSRSSKRRGSSRKTTTATQASDNVESTTTKPSRGRKTIPPRRTRPTPRQKTSSTPSSSTTPATSQNKSTQRSRLRAGVNGRNGKHSAKTPTSTSPSTTTTVTTPIPSTTVRRTTPARTTTMPSTPLSSVAFVPLQAELDNVHSNPKVNQFKENENIHHKPAFASDSIFLNGGFEEEPVRGTDGGWQGVPPKVVGPLTFGAGRRNFRPLPEEGVILDAQEKATDNRMSPNKEQMKVGEKFIGVPLTVIDPVMSGGAGRDTRPVASHAEGAILEDMKRPSVALKPTAGAVESARLLPPPNDKFMASGVRPLVPFEPNVARQDVLPSRLKTDGFNEENMEVVPEKDPSRFEEPIGVPPKPVGPLSIRPLPKKTVDDSQTDNLKSRIGPGERVFIPPGQEQLELTTQHSRLAPAKAHSIALQHNSGNRDSSGIRFISRTEAPARNLVSSSSTAFDDRRSSGRVSNAEKPHDIKSAQRGGVTTPLPTRRYSDANSVRQKSRVTESPTIPPTGREDVSGVEVKPRPNSVTPFPLWIDPRLSTDTEDSTSSPKNNRTPARPVASKRVTIPFPFEEDEPQNGVKTRFNSRPQQQQRVTFAPNPTKSADTSSSRSTTTVKPQPLPSSFRPRPFPLPPKQHNTVSTTPQVPTTTLDDASGEDYSDEEEELEESVTFPPRRSTMNPDTLQAVARTKVTPSPFESRASTPLREHSLSKSPSPQNSFVSQQFVPENTPRRTNFQLPRAVGTNLPLEQDTEVSSSMPKVSSVRAQSPQTLPGNMKAAMAKEMINDKDMPMKAETMVTTSPQTEFLSTEDIEDDDTASFEPTNFNRPMSDAKGMPLMGDRISPSAASPSTPRESRLPEIPRAVEPTTESTRNIQRNTESKPEVPFSNSRSMIDEREPFSVPAQSRFVSLENEPSSMPARGRNSLPFEPSFIPSQNGFQHSMEKGKSSSLPTSALPPRQVNSDGFGRTTDMHTSPLALENGSRRTTMPPALSSADVAATRPAPQRKTPMPEEMMPMQPQLKDEGPFNGRDFPDDASPPQPSGRLITPSLASNPHRLAGPSDLSRASQFFESPSFVIRKPVNQPAARDQVQLVPEVPEDLIMAKNQPMIKSEARTVMPKLNNEPMIKPEPQEGMSKSEDLRMVKPEAREVMPTDTAQPMLKSSAQDAMINMKDIPMTDFEETSKSVPAQQRPTVLEQVVTSPRSLMNEQNSKISQTQPAGVTNANPEEAVEYEYYYDS